MSATQNPFASSDSLGSNHQAPDYVEKESLDVDFKADWKLYLVFATLCILALAAALDGTCLGTALPVCSQPRNSLQKEIHSGLEDNTC